MFPPNFDFRGPFSGPGAVRNGSGMKAYPRGRPPSPFPSPSSTTTTSMSKPTSTSTTTSAALDWSFLDSVYLIHCPNGDTDGTRIKSTKSILDDINLLESVTIKEFETDDEDRVRGCYTSHVSVYIRLGHLPIQAQRAI